MTSKSLRRLASDHASLHTQGLPPNYLFPPGRGDTLSDLTSLSLLLAGPEGTPFSSGIFSLDMLIPPTYPQTAPTASFRTKIFHPNVDPVTGAICVDTLKRDWKPELTLRDILVTIGCLLVFPNPASALNAEAGRLCEEEFEEYERKARLWARMHAAVPENLREVVEEARRRGDTVVVAGPSSSKKAAAGKRKGVVVAQEDVFVREDSVKTTTPPPRKPTIMAPPPPAAAPKGLGIDLPEEADMSSSALLDIETPTQPPPARRRRKPAAAQDLTATTPALINAAAVTMTPQDRPLLHSNPSTPRPPDPKRRRVTPDTQQISPVKPALPPPPPPPRDIQGTSADIEYAWVNWRTCSPLSSPEDARRKRRRKRDEQTRLASVGGCVKRYNTGIFGPRIGIERL